MAARFEDSEELVDWIAFLELEEERELKRLVDALSIVALQLFGKKE